MSGDATAEFRYRYPRPAMSADVVVTAQIDGRLSVLLVRRANDPYQGYWALPGGFLEGGERLEACARRELAEETSVEVGALVLVGLFDDPDRVPSSWTISAAFWAKVDASRVSPIAGDDAEAVDWWFVDALPPMAFDHEQMIGKALAFG